MIDTRLRSYRDTIFTFDALFLARHYGRQRASRTAISEIFEEAEKQSTTRMNRHQPTSSRHTAHWLALRAALP